MPKDTTPGKPTKRRYSPDEKAAAVRMIRTLRAELGTEHGTIQRVASQLGYGTESVRSWVRQADVDEGHVPGVSTSEAAKMKALEQENRELKRANEMADSSGQRNISCEMGQSLTTGGSGCRASTVISAGSRSSWRSG
ncbi:transposase, partial [Kocuria sp. JC486]|uniref:transposase n=1 Tax=Kocuria sp. JC486 TaxID=1970736 RepID=UPI001FD73036